MRGNVNDSKRVSPYDLGGIAKLSGKPVSLTDSLSHSRRTPKELLERIASLESQLAEAKADLSNTREAWNECENTLAEAKARLAGYEVGFDPATNPPKDMEQVLFVDEFGEFYRGGFDSEGKYWWQTVVITSSHISGQGGEIPQETIIRWFPLPDAKEEK